MTAESNVTGLAQFVARAEELKAAIPNEYDRSINRDLAQQKAQELFGRNVTGVLRAIYATALSDLHRLPLQANDEANVATLSAKILETFDGIIEELIVYALNKHATSCALSNFPDESRPSVEYVTTVIRDASNDWAGFAARVDGLLRG